MWADIILAVGLIGLYVVAVASLFGSFHTDNRIAGLLKAIDDLWLANEHRCQELKNLHTYIQVLQNDVEGLNKGILHGPGTKTHKPKDKAGKAPKYTGTD